MRTRTLDITAIRNRFIDKYVECPTTGCWLWTGAWDKQGYGNVGVSRGFGTPMKIIRAHIVSWGYVHGPVPKGFELDHRCGCKACVNPDHLRLATRSQNRMNIGKPKNNTSGFKGVVWSGKEQRWAARIGVNGKQTTNGRFKTAEEASNAYKQAALNLHGNFANTN